MIFDEPKGRVWLYTKPTDMRKSYHGLSAGTIPMLLKSLYA